MSRRRLLLAPAACALGARQDPSAQMEGVLPYLSKRASFADRGSHFCLWWEQGGGPMGLQHLLLPWNRVARILTDRLLGLRLLGPGGEDLLGAAPGRIRYFPHGVITEAAAGDLEVRSVVLFEDLDVVLLGCELVNRGRSPVRYVPALAGCTARDRRAKSAEYLAGERTLRVHYNAERTDLRDPVLSFDVYWAVRASFEVAGGGAGPDEAARLPAYRVCQCDERQGEQAVYYHLEGAVETLAPGQRREFQVWFSLAIDGPEAALDLVRAAARRAAPLGEQEARARQEWNRLFASLPPLPEESRAHQRLYQHAAVTLRQNTAAPFSSEPWRQRSMFGQYRPVYPNRNNYSAVWVSDGLFHALALLEYDPALALEQMRILVSHQFPNGMIPMMHGVTSVVPGWGRLRGELKYLSQFSLFSYVLLEAFGKTSDRRLLEEFYGPLERFNAFWYAERDPNRDGIPAWAQSGESMADNSPRYDLAEQAAGAEWQPGSWDVVNLVAVDLNGMLIADSRCLAHVASLLGRQAEARGHWDRAGWLARRTLQLCYSRADDFFWDYHLVKKGFKKVRTLHNFLPLWAGVPLESARARRMLERHLLEAAEFYGAIPFPVVARNDPKFEAGGYWRGPCWLNLAYFMLQLLWRYGYRRQADESCERVVAACERLPYIPEYLNTVSGEGLGSPEYSWSAAFLMLMLLRRYREPEAWLSAPRAGSRAAGP
jgi:hypothetical protein